MKRIAFFGYNLEIGGAEKSLVNIINILKDEYNIDLYLYEKKGELLSNLPQNINIYELKKNNIQYFFFKYFKNYRKKYLNKICSQKYDSIVAYVEGRLATIITEIDIECPKIAWIHTNVTEHDIGISEKEIIESYSKINKIVFVSNEAKEDFANKYNIPKDKLITIENILNVFEINEMAKEKIDKSSKFTFINVSRMRPEKRHNLLIEACKILKQKGYEFEMWFVGDGVLYPEIKKQIIKDHLINEIKLFGKKSNPYPYIKTADCFVLSSDYEGQSLVAVESLILKTPVITTDIPVVNKLLDNKYGIVCEHNAQSIADSMIYMLNTKNYKQYNQKVMKFNINYDNLIKEVKELLENEK